MAGEIEQYCSKNQIAPKLASRIQLTFEEAAQLLVPAMADPRLQAVCEYSEAAERAAWTIRYAGPRLDVTEAGDELALAVLAGMTENMDYAFEAGQELPNRLTLKVRHA